jgi:polyketide cyclase/dehydrase/lipid transport protein
VPRVTATIAASPERCWRTFTDPSLLKAWVPGLKRARVVRRDDDGRPLEIAFEFGETLTYSLVYTYEPDARSVRWSPRAGKRDAVEGSVRFDADGDGCLMTYELETSAATLPRERSVEDAERTVAAFVAFLARSR